MSTDLGRLVRDAHGDLWQAEGRLRADRGGGALEMPGARLMASGIPDPQWNNADLTDDGEPDLDAVAAWYDEGGMP